MEVAAVVVDLRGGIPVIEHWRHAGTLVSYSSFWASSLELDIGKRDQQKAMCLCLGFCGNDGGVERCWRRDSGCGSRLFSSVFVGLP
jgi:hypothetical protein